jgi:cation diffusion facilitator CzcD-associated flavoprotein CzcO
VAADTASPASDAEGMPNEYLDVLIVGAGIAGIGAACHLQQRCPAKRYAILEARDGIGGTWDLFRYPGIRSDTDMHTMGYRFRPWTDEKSIADGPSILRYLHQTSDEHDVTEKIRFHHRVVRVEWSMKESHWTVEAERSDTGEIALLTCGFLYVCSGYYRYDEGYSPELPGSERFEGQIVHPQLWPEDLNYEGKRIVVIGSGATAVTLVPALSEQAAQVTMLQRSPGYVISIPARDLIANTLRRALPNWAAYPLVRWKNVLRQMFFYILCRQWPQLAKWFLRKRLERLLPDEYDVDTHFKPRYNPWDKRLCVVADGDLFKAISTGRASIITDRIDTFTEDGIKLESGTELEADLIVTATGLNMMLLGGIEVVVDGGKVDLAKAITYKGMMLSGVPNLALAIGYMNASWTLKVDLTAEYICRLLAHMDAGGHSQCLPELADSSIRKEALFNTNSGHVQRSLDQLPKQGSKAPWRLRMNYVLDLAELRFGAVDDGTMRFSGPGPP